MYQSLLEKRAAEQPPANSGPFVHLQEISGSTRLRGGAGRTRTSNQAVSEPLRRADHEFDVAAMALVINFVPDAPKAGAPRSLLQVGSSTSRARPTASGS